MKRIAQQSRLLVLPFIYLFSFNSYSQGVTGIWKGYFIADDGSQYRLEFQVKQNDDGAVSVKGVSYSWQDDIKFYGKATMTGSFMNTSKNFRIKEIRTVEVKTGGFGGTCIMNYNLSYSRSGKEEFLEGTYLGKPEVKGRENPYEWGDCGGGKVFLRKVTSSDFYIEPFLRKKDYTTTPAEKDTVEKKSPPPIIKKPLVTTTNPVKKPVAGTKPPLTKKQPVVSRNNPRERQRPDTIAKINLPVIKDPVKEPIVITPRLLTERSNELMKSLVVNDPEITVKLYDNGEIDGDSISIFYDKKLLLSHQGLSTSPIIVKLKIDDENSDHELVMVAENLGRIPPNTALMVVDAGDQRFKVQITSNEQKNALVRFRYERPK
ncbi:MAG: hypothetical protein Q8941_21755 [Bacteroidota bacterium]|nr:hypothetical protein [Bacteroidota bacterium]